MSEPATPQAGSLKHLKVTIGGRQLDCQRIGAPRAGGATLVFLHEGLGSIGLWKNFPSQLASACGLDALVYSRQGSGHSAPLEAPRKPDYMHIEALQVLPSLLQHLDIRRPLLVGHSDGGSIALIYGGQFAAAPVGIIAIAPHLFVESMGVASIAAAKVAYETTDLRARLARHHSNVDNTFYGWNDIWLNPDFLAWNIEDYVARIRCPVLAVQGCDDEYGTMRQIDRIAELAPQAELLKLPECRHSPHREQPDALIAACERFVRECVMPAAR